MVRSRVLPDVGEVAIVVDEVDCSTRRDGGTRPYRLGVPLEKSPRHSDMADHETPILTRSYYYSLPPLASV